MSVRPTSPDHPVHVEPSPRWVRGFRDGRAVVDSRRVKLVYEGGNLPVWFFPAEDVAAGVEPSRRGEDVDESLAGHVHLDWWALECWMEEEEEVFVHPRDPYHRVDALRSSRHVRVSLDGEPLAESRRPRALFETGLPTRWYLPPQDVREELLVDCDDVVTACPYKGTAEYRSVRIGDRVERALVWRYVDPIPEAGAIAGLWCFFDERVDVDVDGERQERPRTRWSGGL